MSNGRTCWSSNFCFEFSVVWRISHFPLSLCTRENFIQSNSFTIDPMKKSEWCLKVYPGTPGDDTKYVGIFLQRLLCSEEYKETTISFKISLHGKDEEVIKYGRVENHTFDENVKAGWKRFIGFDELFCALQKVPDEVLTIRLCINYAFFSDAVMHTSTEFKCLKKAFNWTVPIPECLFREAKLNIEFNEFKYEIKVSVLRKNIYFAIKPLKEKDEKTCLKSTISILDKYEKVIGSVTACHKFKANSVRGFTFPACLPRSSLDNHKDEVSDSKQMRLSCEISHSNENSELKSSRETIAKYGALHHGIETMYRNEIHCDIILNADIVTFKAHKGILSVRSPVFAALIDKMTDNLLMISDLKPDVLKLVLDFIYTDNVRILDMETANNLSVAAEKYKIVSLKEKCTKWWESGLTPKTVYLRISTALDFGNRAFAIVSLRYFARHKQELLTKNAWIIFKENQPKRADRLEKNKYIF